MLADREWKGGDVDTQFWLVRMSELWRSVCSVVTIVNNSVSLGLRR